MLSFDTFGWSLLLLLLRGKDETTGIEDLGSVLRDSSIKALRLPIIWLV